MIIDTHCHLDDARFRDDVDAVIQKAYEQGVQGIIIPGADIDDLGYAQELAHRYEHIFFAAGIHPYHHEQYDEKILRTFLKDEKCIAVGECGLDYFRLPEDAEEKHAEKQIQQEIFAKQIALAREIKKPLIVHIRDANEDSRRLLVEGKAHEVGGVLHCYNASKHLLDLANSDFYFGIGGVLTFKNAKNLVEVLPLIPKEKLLLETDAPYLTPMPYRGERNEPAYTLLVAEKMAELLNMSVTELHNLTSKNAFTLFKALEKIKLATI
ncbi:TatD family hydrolase [Sulfurospirillum arsenophilum]|uniref:TatD family hydrolase n=1 Tax=Sulfurospirillum arsenophilum TaxID=56698 RepID=UPI0005A776DD|nr:TatD family hydrolase [Sulfurospirillum arsenophilum]